MTILRHGNSWWYKFEVRGILYRERTGANTKEEASQIEAARRAEVKDLRVANEGEQPSPRFREFAYGEFQQWLAVEHRDRPSTFARYMRSIKVLSAFFGERTLQVLDAGVVEQFKIQRSQQTRKNFKDGRLVTPAAVNRDLAVLRILFNFALRLRKVRENPVAQVHLFRERQNHVRVLSLAEEKTYLASASPLLCDVATLMLETGMRPGEIYRLQATDLDVELRSVFVRSGKTDNATRYIPLTERGFAVLASRANSAKDKWLFPSRFSAMRPVLDVKKAHKAALARCGIKPPFRLYDLRHTALTRLAMAGVDLPTLKELAGHSQIQMTMRYVHPTPEHKRRAIEKFSAFTKSLSEEQVTARA
ncbi:MAG: site-specific integrase [Acidobacteria bacterium]|nr:site-specific integrase [Acidobacteriota bacterium]